MLNYLSGGIFVGNLPEDVTEKELRQLFQTYGTIEKTNFTKTSKSKQRFTFIYFQEKEATERVLAEKKPFVCQLQFYNLFPFYLNR